MKFKLRSVEDLIFGPSLGKNPRQKMGVVIYLEGCKTFFRVSYTDTGLNAVVLDGDDPECLINSYKLWKEMANKKHYIYLASTPEKTLLKLKKLLNKEDYGTVKLTIQKERLMII